MNQGTWPGRLLLALAFTIANSVLAEDKVLPDVDEIVARYVTAIGGAEKLKQLFSLVSRGEYREKGVVTTDGALVKMRPYYKLVGDPEKRDPDFSEGYDGSAWEFYKDPGIVLRTVGKAAAATRHGLAIDGPLFQYREKGSAITLHGIETIDGQKAYRLRVRMADGFEEEEFINAKNWFWIASRKIAASHAFGGAVATETRFSDFRPVNGILFPFSSKEVEIATGKVLNEMRTTSIVANQQLDPAIFSPPVFPHTLLQTTMELLFGERTDVEAVMWTYRDFRRAHPDVETDEAMQVIGYQMLKMGDHPAAVALLTANAADYSKSSGAAFGLGRAWRETRQTAKARAAFGSALRLDPKNERALQALNEMDAESGFGKRP
jgi:hypothetical protein